jgi:uncharacterized OsmC-like protein
MSKVVGQKQRKEMPLEALRALQDPIKARYTANPTRARVVLAARGALGNEVTFIVDGNKPTHAGLHPAVGGTGQQACPGEMMLSALLACAGVTMAAVATYLGIKIAAGAARAEGELDLRGTLGLSDDVPVGFQSITLTFDLDTAASDEQLKTLAAMTEQYCVVARTLEKPPRFCISRRNPNGTVNAYS